MIDRSLTLVHRRTMPEPTFKPRSTWAAYSMLAVAMISINLGALIAKHLFPIVGAVPATAMRLGVAAALLTALTRPWRLRLDRRVLLAVLPYGTALGAMNLLFYLALQRLPLGVALAVEFTGPLALAVCTSRKLIDLAWACLAAGGLLLLLQLRAADRALDPVGLIYGFGAGLGWAIYILTGRRAGTACGAHAVTLGIVIGAVVVVPFGAVQARSISWEPRLLGMGVMVAILSGVVPFTCEMVALRRLSTRAFSTLTSAESVVGALLGVLVVGDRLALPQCIGIGLIVSAAAGCAMSSRGQRAPEQTMLPT